VYQCRHTSSSGLINEHLSKGITRTKGNPTQMLLRPCSLFKVLCDLEALAGCTPRPVGESEEWAAVIRADEDNLESYSLALQGKTLYSAL
jgi:hypothetical protein